MTDKALKGNKLTKKFNLNITSLEPSKHIKDRKKIEIMFRKARENRENKKAYIGRGKK